MVRINKTGGAPNVLEAKGKPAVSSYKKLLRRGKEINVPATIYNDTTVKTKLISLQKDKCCFCEAKVSHVSHGDVEHFRPKNGYKQEEGQKLQKPGYYWLAYNWDNLFFACQKCNQSYKRNWFPLLDDSKRAKNHKENIKDEEPLIIDPGKEDPSKYIEYYGSAARAIDGNEKGETTIDRTGLRRPKLNEHRFAKLEAAKLLYDSLIAIESEHPHKKKIEDYLDSLSSVESEYSLMFKCALRDGFKYL